MALHGAAAGAEVPADAAVASVAVATTAPAITAMILFIASFSPSYRPGPSATHRPVVSQWSVPRRPAARGDLPKRTSEAMLAEQCGPAETPGGTFADCAECGTK